MLHIYRSSRVEILADMLGRQLHLLPPESVLAPQTLIVGHLGMKRWLTQRLAERRLGHLPRIAANLEMLLPSEWLDHLAQSALGTEAIAIAPYRRAALRWRIYELLPELEAPEVARYLTGDDVPRRRFQLADRIAGLYGQYLVYRCDWLLDWEHRRAGAVADHWQGELWRLLVERVGLPHRGQRMRELARHLAHLPADPDQPALHIFGVSHLPPDALNALERLADTREVFVYFPDPCRELWEDLRTRRAIYRAQLEGAAFLTIGHPLLATLGRLGQHFSLLLNSLDSVSDDRDVADAEPDGPLSGRPSLLQRTQHSVRMLQPEWARRQSDDQDPRCDASIRVHVCHTRLRELEVLKDALLDRLASEPQLHPRDIVVMAPNMALYAPLLPVVFGEPGRGDGPLPYHLTDVALVRSHPLLAAFRELIDLPTLRITRSQVLALLALPAVALRFNLDGSRHVALSRWLERCHVAWGLDGGMKADFGAAPVDDNSFAFGLDRMCAGFLVGWEDPDWLLDDQILPADPVYGPDAQCLGALSGLLEVLNEWRETTRRSLPARQWSERLRDWIARLFEGNDEDAEERDALSALAKLVSGIASECTQAGVDPEIDWTVLREILKQGLDGIPERQPFLVGGITFCGMVPQRAIPFRVIALLGLNDGDYPRTHPDTGLDLMQRHPRLGDRDNRMDDRYLFLEALMSARDALHLSYVGEGAQDGKPRNPALPLSELMSFLDEAHDFDRSDDQPDRPWRVRHPLQPFDARYFNPAGDPRLYSYSSEFASASRLEGASEWRFLSGASASTARAQSPGIELAAICRFFAKPSDWLCKSALSLSRDALGDEAGEDKEPLSTARHPFDRTAIEMIWDALRRGKARIPKAPPARLIRSGQLAAGVVGQRAYAVLRDEVQPILDLTRSLAPFAGGRAEPAPVAVSLRLGETQLVGTLSDVFRAGDGLWLVAITSSKNVSYQHLVPLYLHWVALRLTHPEVSCDVCLIYPHPSRGPELHQLAAFPTDSDNLRAGLALLLSWYRAAETTAGVYFPRTSFAFAESMRTGAPNSLSVAQKSWAPNFGTGESGYAPGYNGILAGNAEFLESGEAAHGRFAQIAQSLYDVITGAITVEESP